MSNQIPTRREILEKYKDVISSEDFDVLAANELPPPEVLHQEDSSLQYLGTWKDAYLWVKRQCGRVVAVIVFFGGFIQGVEYIDRYSRVAYDQLSSLVQLAQRHCDVPATEYRIIDRPTQWPLPPDKPFQLATTSVPTTTTTTTQAPEVSIEVPLPSGSGLIPYSPAWDRLG